MLFRRHLSIDFKKRSFSTARSHQDPTRPFRQPKSICLETGRTRSSERDLNNDPSSYLLIIGIPYANGLDNRRPASYQTRTVERRPSMRGEMGDGRGGRVKHAFVPPLVSTAGFRSGRQMDDRGLYKGDIL